MWNMLEKWLLPNGYIIIMGSSILSLLLYLQNMLMFCSSCSGSPMNPVWFKPRTLNMAQEQPMKCLDELKFMMKKKVFNETLSSSVLKRFYLHPLTLIGTFIIIFLGEVWHCDVTLHHWLVPVCKDEVAYAKDSMYSVFNGQLHSNVIQSKCNRIEISILEQFSGETTHNAIKHFTKTHFPL